MEEKTFRCPNCGATITNNQNCEYCGSMLVRFASKGIDISHASAYTQKDEMYNILFGAFEKHLEQQNHTQQCTTTNIYHSETDEVLATVTTSSYLKDYLGREKLLPNASDKSIALKLEFKDNKLLEKFKSLKCYTLFYSVALKDPLDATNLTFIYYIDFGTDFNSAAQICIEVIKNLFNFKYNAVIYCKTEIGEETQKYSQRAHTYDEMAEMADMIETKAKKRSKAYARSIIFLIIFILWTFVGFYILGNSEHINDSDAHLWIVVMALTSVVALIFHFVWDHLNDAISSMKELYKKKNIDFYNLK
jgi:ribosomal protein L32